MLAELSHVLAASRAGVYGVPAHVRGMRAGSGHAVDRIHHGVEAIRVVAHDHLERTAARSTPKDARRRCAHEGAPP